jgi:hypothetical protein
VPVTPLHYPFAFLISKSDSRLSLPGLVVGCVIPDVEVPIMWMFFSSLPSHLFLHSLVGALTIGTLLAVVVTHFLYPPIIATIFNVERNELNQVCRISPWMVLSCVLGIISHLVLDFPMHWYNPILWPWVNPYDIVGPLVLVFMPIFDIWTAYLIASSIMHFAMLVIWSAIIVVLHSKGNLLYRHWVKDTAVTEHIMSDTPRISSNGKEPLL